MRKFLAAVSTVTLLLNTSSAFSEEERKVEIGGDTVIYYQGTKDVNGSGYVADITLSFKPRENGELFLRLHAGEGSGADSIEAFANLNTFADDNPENEATFKLLEAYYKEEFLDGKLKIAVGKTEPPVFIDDNEYANDEYSQFVGKPFVNNPIIDGEFQFAPIVSASLLIGNLEFTALVQSNEQKKNLVYKNGEWTVEEKDLYSDMFKNPFWAVQVKFSRNGGNYRLYYWEDLADHIKVGEDTTNPVQEPSVDKSFGVGVSFDQEIFENFGIFGRAAFANDVYEVKKFVSLGVSSNIKDDTLAFGWAALFPNKKLENNKTEHHFEGYYRKKVGKDFYITPDIQYIINPNGKDSDVLIGMVKAEISF
ncbi:MAG: carbohydrate porin [Desulfurobacteriaceae bacterium]